MVIETWNSQQSNRNMYLRSQGVDVPNVKLKFNFTIMALRALDGRHHF